MELISLKLKFNQLSPGQLKHIFETFIFYASLLIQCIAVFVALSRGQVNKKRTISPNSRFVALWQVSGLMVTQVFYALEVFL